MSTETLTVKSAPQPLDLLLFRRFKRQIPGFVEQTLGANYGLAALGPILPLGTKVVVQVPAPAPTKTTRKSIRLYD